MRIIQLLKKVSRAIQDNYPEMMAKVCAPIIVYALYTPFIHLYCHTYTYVHPLYMYIHPYNTPNTPLNTPLNTL